jgi:hypothetical protein
MGKIAAPGTYRATSYPDGSILLEPAVTLTETELAVLQNPQVSADLEQAFAGTAEIVDVDWKS